MMKLRMLSAFGVAVGTVVTLGAGETERADAATPPRCSIAANLTGRDTSATHFLAVALEDTVLAGPGTVKASPFGGHTGPGGPRAVYGQILRVDTVGGVGSDAMRTAFTTLGTREVIVVPWDYDPGCEPTFWNGSARWTEPGKTGFYTVRIRPDSSWVGGRPTFDAFMAVLEPYPHGYFYERGYRGMDAVRTRPSLNVREMFTFYEALPPYNTSRDSAALAPIRRWADANPGLAGKYPADAAFRYLLSR